MAKQETEAVQDMQVDLTALAAELAAQEQAEAEILEKAEAIRKKRTEQRSALQAAAEPLIAPFRPELEEIQKTQAAIGVVHKQQRDELAQTQATERAGLDEQMEAILVQLEAIGVKREFVVKPKGGGATGKRGPGLKAASLGVIGSEDSPVKVTAPRRRAGDGVPEDHMYFCDGEFFYGRMSDGAWSQSTRLSEVSSSHGWHDTKDVAAALAFAAGKPYSIMAHPGAVFADGVLVPNGAATEATEVETA